LKNRVVGEGLGEGMEGEEEEGEGKDQEFHGKSIDRIRINTLAT